MCGRLLNYVSHYNEGSLGIKLTTLTDLYGYNNMVTTPINLLVRCTVNQVLFLRIRLVNNLIVACQT